MRRLCVVASSDHFRCRGRCTFRADEEGNQDSTVSVFTKDREGKLRHFYSAHSSMAENLKERGLDLLCPVYNILDLTPQGRKDWYASFDYPAKIHPSQG